MAHVPRLRFSVGADAHIGPFPVTSVFLLKRTEHQVYRELLRHAARSANRYTYRSRDGRLLFGRREHLSDDHRVSAQGGFGADFDVVQRDLSVVGIEVCIDHFQHRLGIEGVAVLVVDIGLSLALQGVGEHLVKVAL